MTGTSLRAEDLTGTNEAKDEAESTRFDKALLLNPLVSKRPKVQCKHGAQAALCQCC